VEREHQNAVIANTAEQVTNALTAIQEAARDPHFMGSGSGGTPGGMGSSGSMAGRIENKDSKSTSQTNFARFKYSHLGLIF
jgi:hypothetical protein